MDKSEIERLGLAMSASARTEPGLIGSAIALWESAHPGQKAADYLRCDASKLWRIAITPRPAGRDLTSRAMELAADVGIYGLALVNVLRFAENAAALAAASDDDEMLMAALDADENEDKDS